MKILYITDTYLPKIDGIAISISNFSRLLAARGHSIIIFCPSYGDEDFFSSEENITIERFPAQGMPSYPDVKAVLPRLSVFRNTLKQRQPDLIHVHTPGFLGMTGLQYALRYKIPVLSTYHTMVNEQHEYMNIYKLMRVDGLLNSLQKSIRKGSPLTMDLFETFTLKKFRDNLTTNLTKKAILNIVNFVYERSQLILTPSFLIKKELESYGVKRPIEVMSNGMDLEAFSGQPKQLPEEARRDPKNYPWKILHVGRISFEKNCDVLLRAFHVFRKKFPKATFTLVGDGPALKSLKELAKKMGDNKAMEFPGFFPHDQLPKLYPKHDFFWTASTMETQGLVVLEAMACGLPALGVTAYALPELIHEGKNGFLASPGQPDTMAGLAEKLVSDADRFESFSRQSLEIASGHEINHCAERLEKIYAGFLAGNYA